MRTLATCLIALGLFAGCVSTGIGLRSASDRLDDTSQVFYRQLADQRAPRETVDDAARLADAADEFNREVRYGRSSDVLHPMFDRVQERYHALRDEVDGRDYDDRYGRTSFDRVTEAYLDVERAMERNFDERYSYRN